jgi:uncharacterized protein YjbI with pentapeptide repeats
MSQNSKKLWRKVWAFLNTDISFPSADTVTSSADAAKSVLELAGALQEHKEVAALAPLIGRMSSVLDVLNLPLVQVAGAGLPFVGISIGLIRFFVEKTRKEPTLELSVLIVSQAAYVESIGQFLRSYLASHPEVKDKLQQTPATDKLAKQIRKLGDALELDDGSEVVFDELEAVKALRCFHESKVAQAYNRILMARLQESGLAADEAQRVTERISRNTHRHMKRSVAEVREAVPKLAALYGEGWLRDEKTASSLDEYLENPERGIASKPIETVFDEAFTFRDIYVPMRVKPLGEKGVDEKAADLDIERWAQSVLLDETRRKQVIFLQGGPGRGKSVFCRMFADWVRRELHPIYTPILIRLRDLTAFENSFDRTLAQAIGYDFVGSDAGWLTDRNTRFLFLLDGFDELLLERGGTDLQQFLDQVAKFQERCGENPERQHRVLITGRPLALFGIERLMPTNLDRMEIIPMPDAIQAAWLAKWQQVVAEDAAEAAAETEALRAFLGDGGCPRQVQMLAREPLLLYLLAAMHRDKKIDGEMFAAASAGGAKVLIYEQALDWVLNKQRPDQLNQRITRLESEDLRAILVEAGLCVVQSGNEQAKIASVEERLKDRGDKDIVKLIEDARCQNQENALKNALAVFYLKSVPGAENSVEFFHKSFGEYLCAVRMVESLQEWTETISVRRNKTQYRVKEEELEWQVYDVFGYGALTVEIVESIRALLEKEWEGDEERAVKLLERLHEFYLKWCEGEFIEADTDTLPQQKSRQLQKQGIASGQRRVDIYAGLNVLILLLELHRYGQSREALKDKVVFYPCGEKDTEEFDGGRLLRIIGYSECLKDRDFNSVVGKFLRGADLSRAYLRGADLRDADLIGAYLSDADLIGAYLSDADLRDADLIGAYLRGAYLRDADLRGAYLRGAYLSGAYLRDADLRGSDLRGAYLRGADLRDADLRDADLRGADLRGADLRGADLRGADLRGADLRGADLSNLVWDSHTQWSSIQGLHEALNIPQKLAQMLNLRRLSP